MEKSRYLPRTLKMTMEGQKPKIRTMARDLERVRQPVSEEKKEPEALRVAEPASPKIARFDSSKIRQASGGGPAQQETPKSRDEARGDERRDEQRLSDILRLARKRVEAPMLPKTLADILPIEPLDATHGKIPLNPAPLGKEVVTPPSNLPTGVPTRQEGPAPVPTAVVTRPALSQRQGKTPEEILGLPPGQARPPADNGGLPSSPKIQRGEPASPARSDSETTRAKLARPVRIAGLKFPLIAGALGLAFLAISGGIYWNFFLREQPPLPRPQPSGPVEPEVPQALMGYDKREILEIGELTYDVVKPKIDGILNREFSPDSLVYVPVKLTSDTEIKYLTLAELFTTLRIDAPPAFYATQYQDFSLFLYSPGEEEKSICKEAKILDASCYGPRLGLAIKLPLQGRNTAFSLMREWEKTIAADLRPLMGAVPRQRVVGDTFFLGRHGDVTTHFINLPISSISVDWILTDEHLVIGTSKNAARRAADKLQ